LIDEDTLSLKEQEKIDEIDDCNSDTNQEVNDNPTEKEIEQSNIKITRSGRQSKPPLKMNLHQCHLLTQAEDAVEYKYENAQVGAKYMTELNNQFFQFMNTYNLKQGIEQFGKKGYEAAMKELKQLNEREVFRPISIQTMTQQEKRRAMDSLIFLVEKRDGRIKARTCANGSTQRSYIEKEDATSPTVLTEAILITAAIEADQQRDIMTVDIPNAFVQTEIKDMKERITMKIKGRLAEMLISLDEQRYKDYMVTENGEKVIYVQVIRALYGMLQASLLFYQKLRSDLEEIGFKINPYDPCVANRMVNGNMHTVTWHVDDLKSTKSQRQTPQMVREKVWKQRFRERQGCKRKNSQLFRNDS